MPLSDTSPEIREKQFEILRSISDEQRFSLGIEMSLFARDLLKDAIRREHPEWSEPQVIKEVLRLALLPNSLPERF
jgi:hypothetical protein